MKINQVIEGLKDPKDNPCWKGYKPVGTKQKGGRTVPNCVPKESVTEAFGPLPKDNQQIRLGRHTVDIERVGLDKNYISFAWNDSKGQEHYEEVPVGDLGSYDDLIDRIKDEIRYQERQYTDQGVAEGKKCPQCGSTNCTCPPGKCNCKPVEGWVPKQASLNEEEYDYYRDYKAGLISYDEYQRLVQQFKDRDRDQRNRERDNDRGPWYLKVNGKILKSRGEVKVFDWKRGANNYALAILKNKPELNGKIYLTRKPEDDQAGVNESKTTVKVPVKQKPRQGPLRPQTGGGAHRDKKKEQKQGKEKHKKPVYEGFDPKLAMELEKLTKADDMFDAIYNALGRNDEVGSYLQDKMYDVARENRLHPDDDIESIIDIMADHLESDFGGSGLDETGMLKVAKDDDNMTILQNPATGVQTQIDKKNPNAPRLTQDETGKLKLSVPQGAQTGQQGQEKKPNLVGKDVAVDSSPVEDVHRISASPSQPGGEITDVNTRSTISGDEDHDEISKLLNQRLRKLAGVSESLSETGADKDLGNGFTLTTTEFNGKMVPAVFDSEGNRHWIKNNSGDRQYGMSQFITIQNGKAVGSNPGPMTAAALKQAGMQTAAPAAPASLAWNQMTPDQQAAFRAKQQADDAAAAQGGQNIQNYLANKRRTPTTPSNEELNTVLKIAGLR